MWIGLNALFGFTASVIPMADACATTVEALDVDSVELPHARRRGIDDLKKGA